MATITFSIPDKEIKEALEKAAKDCGYTLDPNFKVQDVIDEMNEDVLAYVTTDLEEFFSDGIGSDCYTDVMTEDEE